ncbi:MAG TPA: hypothetical protein VHT49_12640 [Acidimicrobiales bacterium]|nr:hypothetical protein [Acidimicrobiales bacterium]
MLSITDLPSGWSVDNSPHNASSSCYSNPLTKVASTSYTHADFAKGGSLPSLSEELGTYSSSTTAFSTIASTLNGCKSFNETSGTESISGTMGPMSAPTYGDQSAAWTATLTIQGVDANQGFVMVRKGSYLMIVALGDIGALDNSTLQGFVAQALAKVP